MIVILKMIWNEKIDMEKIEFLNLNDSLNRHYYVNTSLQGKRRVVHLDEFDSGMMRSID